MPKFTTEDFNKENAQRLSVIIMPKMGMKPLTSFRGLNDGQQKKFNRLMNDYIRSLGEDWEQTLLGDFNQVVTEEILTNDFDPSLHHVPMLNTDRELMLTAEQEEYFRNNPEELMKIKK